MIHSMYRSASRSVHPIANRCHRTCLSQLSIRHYFRAPPDLPQKRVVITGMGMVSPLGVDVSTSWNRLVAGDCAIQTIDRFDTTNLASTIAAFVPREGPGAFYTDDWIDKKNRTSQSVDFIAFALSAAQQAIEDSKWTPANEHDLEQAGVCIGAGIGNLEDIVSNGKLAEDKMYRKISPFFVPRILINLAAGHVSLMHGFKGPNHSTVTACATGAHSIGDAYRFIRNGDAQVMLAGGSESCIHPLAMAGFLRSKALTTKFNHDPTGASRPFDHDRSGFVMGEGAGVMFLEEYESAQRRGVKIYAEIRGYGLSSDAYHITAPEVNGTGAARAMIAALKESGITPSEVDYINAHATSTPLGDLAELNAIQSVFGQHTSQALYVSSSKGALGHLLGAAGAVESIIAVKALNENCLPPTLNLKQRCVDNFNLVPQVADWQSKPSIKAVLSNSFGFGGTNASLCFTKVA